MTQRGRNMPSSGATTTEHVSLTHRSLSNLNIGDLWCVSLWPAEGLRRNAVDLINVAERTRYIVSHKIFQDCVVGQSPSCERAHFRRSP